MRITRKGNIFFGLFGVILAVVLFASMPAGAGAETPAQVVEKLDHTLLQVMKDADALGYAGRYEQLAEVIPEAYDFPYISRIALGRYWPAFTKEEKAEFLDLFARFSVATYAARFDGYSGESFNIISTNESRHGRVVVESLLITPDGQKTEMNYVLHRKDGMWKIINVVVDGVSDLSLKRAEYASFLKEKSPRALLDELKTKIADLTR